MNNKNILYSFKWIFNVSMRFASVDTKSKAAVTSFLSTLGICFGVMNLIIVISVMNGFQMSFVDSIMEISSFHVRTSNICEDLQKDFLDFCKINKNIKSVCPFYEVQGLITGVKTKEAASIIRGINNDYLKNDQGFAKELKILCGKFDLSKNSSIVLGSSLARTLEVSEGSTVNLLALSGSKETALISKDRNFTVTGIFECGYTDINQSYAFINIDDAEKMLGKNAKLIFGLKLPHYEDDINIVSSIKNNFPSVTVQSWREFNRAFFSALKIEKNMMLFLVFLIFVVAAINIYNGMKRLVFERSKEIAVLYALGGTKNEIKAIFIIRGFVSGFLGSLSGVMLGLLITVNMPYIFRAISEIMYFAQYFTAMLFTPQNANYIIENPMYKIYASIPARCFFPEILQIVLFGIAAPLAAAWQASKNVLNENTAEVLHYE